MMKTVYKVTSLATFLILVASPVFAFQGREERQENRQAKMEEHQSERQAKMEERQENREARMEERQEKREERLEERQAKFCERFSEHASNIASRLDDRREKFGERKENRMTRVGERRNERDEQLSEKRDVAEKRREAMYTRLLEKADTDAEKVAVEKFKSTMEAAVTTRQAAVDKAISDFRSGVDTLIASRKDSMTNTGDSFKSAVDAAVAKAKSDCDAGKDVKTVRSDFMEAMAGARETLKEKRQSTDKIGDDIKALAATRNAAIKSAQSAFRSSLKTAKKDLQNAFGEGDPLEEESSDEHESENQETSIQ